MASTNGHESAFSVAEVVGISAAAAAALGGIIIALGRTQANSSNGNALAAVEERINLDSASARGRELAHEAREAAAQRYGTAATAARSYGTEARSVAETGLDTAKTKSKTFIEMFQESILPLVVENASKTRHAISEQAKKADSREIKERSRHFAEEAAVQLREAGDTVSTRIHDDVLPAVTPVVKDASERAGELFEQVRDRADEVIHRSDDVQVKKMFESGKESAQSAAKTTGSAAKDTLSAMIWLSIASALVYLVLLSPERREKVKSLAFNGIEQIRLLVGDFQGYETEF